MKNKTEDNELFDMLKKTLSERFENPVDLETDHRITDWKDAHRAFNSNPNKFPPAHIALIKRIQKKKTEIPFIKFGSCCNEYCFNYKYSPCRRG